MSYYLREPGYRYLVILRACAYLDGKWWFTPVWIWARWLLRHYRYRFGIDISFRTSIGSGLYIGHFGGIIVNSAAHIGSNCNLSHGVTIGILNRGKHQGCPTIGDRVFIGPGAVLLGSIHIGDDAAIGANSVVMEDVPANAVIAGNPGKVISTQGSAGYINHQWDAEC